MTQTIDHDQASPQEGDPIERNNNDKPDPDRNHGRLVVERAEASDVDLRQLNVVHTEEDHLALAAINRARHDRVSQMSAKEVREDIERLLGMADEVLRDFLVPDEASITDQPTG